MMQEPGQKRTRAIVAAVQLSSVSDAEFDASLTELRQLAKTLGFEVVGKFTQKRAGFDKTAYFGTGKREELKEQILEHQAEIILIDHEISPSQAFNLGKARCHGAGPATGEHSARARQRHGRLHQEPAARARRIVQVDAR